MFVAFLINLTFYNKNFIILKMNSTFYIAIFLRRTLLPFESVAKYYCYQLVLDRLSGKPPGTCPRDLLNCLTISINGLSWSTVHLHSVSFKAPQFSELTIPTLRSRIMFNAFIVDPYAIKNIHFRWKRCFDMLTFLTFWSGRW